MSENILDRCAVQGRPGKAVEWGPPWSEESVASRNWPAAVTLPSVTGGKCGLSSDGFENRSGNPQLTIFAVAADL